MKKESDDTYIYYLLMKYGFLIAAGFSILYWVSCTFGISLNFQLFKISVDQAVPFDSTIRSYPYVVTPILYAFMIPWGWFLFRANVDLDVLDLTARNRNRDRLMAGGRNKALLKSAFVIIALAYCGTHGAYLYPEVQFARPYHLQGSYDWFLGVLVLYPFLLSAFAYIFVMVCATYYQLWTRRGPIRCDLNG